MYTICLVCPHGEMCVVCVCVCVLSASKHAIWRLAVCCKYCIRVLLPVLYTLESCVSCHFCLIRKREQYSSAGQSVYRSRLTLPVSCHLTCGGRFACQSVLLVAAAPAAAALPRIATGVGGETWTEPVSDERKRWLCASSLRASQLLLLCH